MRAVQVGTSWAGLLAGPVAWGAATQANYSLVEWQCVNRVPIIPILALCFLAVAVAGGLLSWRAWQRGGASFKPQRELSTERFVAMLGMMVAALFALVIIMQGAASLILDECIR
jgi:O-antigen/teichoic acid export membrane protein